MIITCPQCHLDKYKPTGEVNRALKGGFKIYCGRTCAGIGRRVERSKEDAVLIKKKYDEEYRVKNREKLKKKKHEYFKQSYDSKKAAIERKKNMARHVEYCRSPKYKLYKKTFDRQFRAKKYHGDFWESLLILQDLEKEIDNRMSKIDIRTLNGTLNKHQQRRQEYDRLISNKS